MFSLSPNYLEYEEIYKILRLYVEVRISNTEEARDRLRYMIIDLIDREFLSSKQYKIIYHNDLLLQQQQTYD